jgi:hypothetical protein
MGKKIRYSAGGIDGEPEDGEDLIPTAQMDRELPLFPLPENLEIGFYRMIFQVLGGERKIFSKTEKTIFYLADADYSIDEIAAYLPGYSSGSYLIAPGTVVMLEARLSSGKSLDPYVIWYDGKKQIGEGKSVFWDIPEEDGFRVLRAEIFPFPPLGGGAPGGGAPDAEPGEKARGKTKELSLPVSIQGDAPNYFSPRENGNGEFARHYLFAGDLRDSLDPLGNRALAKEGDEAPLWIGSGRIYGLAVGPMDTYLIPPGENPENREFRFRCKLLRDGSVFSVFFRDSPAKLELFVEQGFLVLTFNAEGGEEKRTEIALPPGEDFISFSLGLGGGFSSAALSLGEAGNGTSLDLDWTPAGTPICRLGSPEPEKQEEEPPDGEAVGGLPVLILDELAVVYGPAE